MGLRTAVLFLGVLAAGSAAWAADFLGPESCKGCHPAAFAIWQQSKHARAMESLSPHQQKDARCLSCHSPDLKGQQVASITCETCHGGGQYYSPAHVMKDPELSRLVGLVDPGEKSCRGCHDASSPSLTPFDFRSALKAIDHWTEDRRRRAGSASTEPVRGGAPAGGK
jgi:formate-dependent nitrite reductase cytochrome c552 subunit